ncbi:Bro-N domain-containing protein [Streptomyces sp. NPDC048370]|uniref:BRO-N domain-containing protein n=1 Tax=Streptomyces sp. NPDC048370 TaxID=3365540 RepID=UPI003712D22F
MDEYQHEYGRDEDGENECAQRDAIDIGDFVFAATGTRVRRLTMPDGTHWFPAVEVARQLGYANARQAVLAHVEGARQRVLGELVRGVRGADVARELAGRGLRKSVKMVDLQGLVQLVTAGTKPACAPFKAWVSEVVAAIQRDGSYGLEPSPAHWGYVLPPEIVDIVVRLEASDLVPPGAGPTVPPQRDGHHLSARALLASWQADHLAPVADQPEDQSADQSPDQPEDQSPDQSADQSPDQSPDQPASRSGRVDVRDMRDVHAVAACLAPALVRGGARYRLEEIARRTGLAVERVRDCVGLLVERGCVRESPVAADGARIYLLP